MYDSVETFKALAYERVGQDRLAAHLAEAYGVAVASLTELSTAACSGSIAPTGRRWWPVCSRRPGP